MSADLTAHIDQLEAEWAELRDRIDDGDTTALERFKTLAHELRAARAEQREGRTLTISTEED